MSNPFKLKNIINLPLTYTSPLAADGKHIWIAKESVADDPSSVPKIVYKIPYDNPSNYSVININNLTAMYGAISSNGMYVGLLGQTLLQNTNYHVIIMKCDDPQNTQILAPVPNPCNAITLDSKYVWCSSLITNQSVNISQIYQISFGGIILSKISLPNNSNILSLSSDGTNLWAATAGSPDFPSNTITKVSCSDISNVTTINLGANNFAPESISSDGKNVWVGVAGYSEPTPNKVIKISCSTLNKSEISMVSVPTSVSSNGIYVFVSCVNPDDASSNNGVFVIDCVTSSILYPTLSENEIPNISAVAYNGKYGWASDRGLNGPTIIYQYVMSSYIPQLENPYNVNFVAPGIKSNDQWTKAITIDSTLNIYPLNQNWSSISTSNDGKFVLACVNGGQIFSSSNYGYNLQPDSSSILPSSANWSTITISYDGTKAAACVNEGNIYIATLSGSSWTWVKTTAPSAAWTCIAYSGLSSGIAACIDGGNVYFSNNNGSSWNTFSSPVHSYISIGYIGQDASQRFVTSTSDSLIIVYRYVWETTSPYYNTWYIETNVNLYSLSAISSAISTDYSIFGCMYGGGIYVSSDVGSTWTQTSAPIANWSSIASNNNGQYIVACVNGGGIYSSIDYGASWLEQTNGLSNPSSWKCVATASNSSGSFLVGCVQNDYIYISPYFQGYQWNNSFGQFSSDNTTHNNNWISLATDSNGQIIIGAIYGELNGYIYISNDYGITWTKQNSDDFGISGSQNWNFVSSNSSGSILGAVIWTGATYIKNYSDTIPQWTLQTLEATDTPNCNQISFNSSGLRAVVCSYYTNSSENGKIYITNDTSSNTWTAINPLPNTYLTSWTAIKFSSDHQRIFACYWSVDPTDNYNPKESGIYKGTFTNQTWNWTRIKKNTSPYPIYYYNSITCSDDYLVIAATNICEANESSTANSNIWISTNEGTTFSSTNLGQNVTSIGYGFQCVTMDPSGNKIAVAFYNNTGGSGNVYTSFDKGTTWISQSQGLPTSQNNWRTIASNQDMSKLIIASNSVTNGTAYDSSGIFTSFLSKSCWTPQLNVVPTRNCFTKLTSSTNGQYLAVVAANQSNNNDYGGIWVSMDYGTTWIKSTAENLYWNAICSDNTGQYLVAGVYGGQIYTSSNYGLNWTIQSSTSGLPTSANWSALSFSNNSEPSSTTQYVYASVANGQTSFPYDGGWVYVSSNRGLAWSIVNLYTTWGNGIASSSNGKYMYIGALYQPNNNPASFIYGTDNYGSTTTTPFNNTFEAEWNYVATDSTGKYIVAVNTNKLATYGDINTGIWLRTPPNSTWTQIASKALYWTSISILNMGNYLLISAICTNGLVYTYNYYLSIPPIPSDIILNGFFSESDLTPFPESGYVDLVIWDYETGPTTTLNQTGSFADYWTYTAYMSQDPIQIFTWWHRLFLDFVSGTINWYPPIPDLAEPYNIIYIFFENSPEHLQSFSIQTQITIPNNNLTSYTLSFYSFVSKIETPDTEIKIKLKFKNTNNITFISNDLYLYLSDKNKWIYQTLNFVHFNPNSTYTFSLELDMEPYFGAELAFTGFNLYPTPPPTPSSFWTLHDGLPSSQWNDIKSCLLPSGDAQLVICSSNGGIWKSSDSGITWSQSVLTTTSGHAAITSSSSGQNLAAIVNNGFLYSSTDYGSLWFPLINSLPYYSFMPWFSISSSNSGQYIVASTIIGEIYKSQNYGETWIKSLVTNSYPLLSMSKSGKYIVAASNVGSIYISSDYGTSWTQLTTVNGLPSISEAWSAITISSTGQYIVASINNGYIYLSSNFGISWLKINFTSDLWSSLAISDSGQFIVATINGGAIYGSSDFGISLSIINSSVKNWSSIAISGTGQYITAATREGELYKSSNFGLAWLQINTITDNVDNITLSISGQYLGTININETDPTKTDIFIYSNYMDIGNIFCSLINQLQLLIQP
jgi:hypothetical protein